MSSFTQPPIPQSLTQELDDGMSACLQRPCLDRAAIILLHKNPYAPVDGELPPPPPATARLQRVYWKAAYLYHGLLEQKHRADEARLLYLAALMPIFDRPDYYGLTLWGHYDINWALEGQGEFLESEKRAEQMAVKEAKEAVGLKDYGSVLRSLVFAIGDLLRFFEGKGGNLKGDDGEVIYQLDCCLELLQNIDGSKRDVYHGTERSERFQLLHLLRRLADSSAPALEFEERHITRLAADLAEYFELQDEDEDRVQQMVGE